MHACGAVLIPPTGWLTNMEPIGNRGKASTPQVKPRDALEATNRGGGSSYKIKLLNNGKERVVTPN